MAKVAASILSADFANLGNQVKMICQQGADFVHMDVMDGHFVPNLTFGAPIIKAVKPFSSVPLDVHLMMTNPQEYIDDFINAGADRLIIHQEITADVQKLLKYIRKKGIKAGICLKPATSVKKIQPLLKDLDLILVMTVNPGFAGQSFMKNRLSKITQAKKMVQGYDIEIEVDGGINDITGDLAVKAGADTLVAGSYIFNSKNTQKAINLLKGL
ncbi:MAG: ribulose-phosphate 3-epimerase [Alphaproteobacteria bacterium]